MTGPALLLLVALLVGHGGSRWLRRSRWPRRAPAVGLLVWHAWGVAVIAALVLAGLSLALPALPAAHDLPDLVGACVEAVRSHYASPAGALSGVLGLAWVLLLVGRLIGYARRVRRLRGAVGDDLAGRLARDTTALDGAALAGPGRVLLVPDEEPQVYCLPRPGAPREDVVVVTSAARRALSDAQLRQVLAHEEAHLRGRHDRVLLRVQALELALGGRLGSSVAREEVATLLEMQADDAVSRPHRRHLAEAVLALATAATGASEGGPESARPARGLSATGGAAVARVSRLVSEPEQLRFRQAVAARLGALLLVLVPFAAAAPGLSHTAQSLCHLMGPHT